MMEIKQPIFRVCLPQKSGGYISSASESYLADPRYANDRVSLIRSYHLLEKDLCEIFDFIEPSDKNLNCFSHKIYALFLRAATEFETNAKAILLANGCGKKKFNIEDYYKLNALTKLSKFETSIPIWNGVNKKMTPLKDWDTGHSMSWYQNYNEVKHNRDGMFELANLENTLKAVSSVFCILFSQFNILAFAPNHGISWYEEDDGFQSYSTCLLAIKLPNINEVGNYYNFDWETLKNNSKPYKKHNF